MLKKISKEEVSQFCYDFNELREEKFTMEEAYKILQLLEERRQTAQLALINRALAELLRVKRLPTGTS